MTFDLHAHLRDLRIRWTRDAEVRRLRRREAELIAKLADSAILRLDTATKLLEMGQRNDALQVKNQAVEAELRGTKQAMDHLVQTVANLETLRCGALATAEHLSQRLAEVKQERDALQETVAKQVREATVRRVH